MMAGPHQVAWDGGVSFAVAPGPGSTYALLAELAGDSFAPDVHPRGYAAFAYNFPHPSSYAAPTVAFLKGGGGQLAFGILDYRTLDFGTIPGPDATFGGWTCSTQEMTGDAALVGPSFLVAASSNLHVSVCGGPADGPPLAVQLFLQQPPNSNGLSFTALDYVQLLEPVARVRLSPRSDGAWMLTQTRSSMGALSSIRAFRISTDAHAVDPGVDVVPPARTGFAVASRGDGFTLAWIEPPGTGGAAISVTLFDAAGKQVASVSIPLALGASVTDPVSLLTSPDGSTLLVAWSQHTPGSDDLVHVARIGCPG